MEAHQDTCSFHQRKVMPNPTSKKRAAPLGGLSDESCSLLLSSSCPSCCWCQHHNDDDSNDEDSTDEITRAARKRTKLHGSIPLSMSPPPTNPLNSHDGTPRHHTTTTGGGGNPSRPSYHRIGNIIQEIEKAYRQQPLSLVVPFVSLEQPEKEDDKATTHRKDDCLPVTTSSSTPTQPSIRASKKDSKHQPRMLRRNSFLIPKHQQKGMTLFQVTRRRNSGGGGGDNVLFF